MKGFCAISIQGKRHLLIQSFLDKLQLRIFRFSHRQLSFVVWVINPLPCRKCMTVLVYRKSEASICRQEEQKHHRRLTPLTSQYSPNCTGRKWSGNRLIMVREYMLFISGLHWEYDRSTIHKKYCTIVS